MSPLPASAAPQPLVTAIVSTYASERFIRGCLDDLVAQTLFDRMEVVVIDSGSPQDEAAIVAEYARRHPQIRLLRTEREPLYAAWNRAIGVARGTYLTNANTDDRHDPRFMEVMTAALEREPDAALAYSDQYISHVENETVAECRSRGRRLRRAPPYAAAELLFGCMTGSQPLWRRSCHDALGLFDTSYRIAADYDMWLRIGARHGMVRVAEPVGSFYESPSTLSGSGNRVEMNREILQIKLRHLRSPHWAAVLDGCRSRIAAGLFALGYQHIEHDADSVAAAPLIREAIRLDPYNWRYRKTYLLRCAFRGARAAALAAGPQS